MPNCTIIISPAQGTRLSLFQAMAMQRSLVLVLHRDDISDEIYASCYSRFDTHIKTKKVGMVLDNVEVHTFGLDDLPSGTIIELSFVSAEPDVLTRSVDQFAAIKVNLHQQAQQAG